MAWLSRASAILGHVAEAVLMFSFTCMGVAIMTQICLRAAGYSFLIMEDVTSFGCFWLVFSGAALAFRDRSHVTVDLLVTYLGPKPRQVVELVAQVSVLVFLVLFIWSGVRLTVNNMSQYGMQLRISMAYVYFLLPFGGAISLVIVLTYFWRDVLRFLGRDAA
jgi:C4-dicarboxylate transporter DctQ subunit